jgi:hypothetical protein
LARPFICEECQGRGLHAYERGPVERCPRCEGVGLVFPSHDTAARDFCTALTASQGAELVGFTEADTVRALAWVLAQVEARCEAVERELERLR